MGGEQPGKALRIAVARPLWKTFLYEAGGYEGIPLQIGQRVRVPFGSGEALGFFLGWEERPKGVALKPIEAVLEDAPALTEEIYALVCFAAKHYRAPLGEALKAALPPGLNVAKPAPAQGALARRRKVQPLPEVGEVSARPTQLSGEQEEVLHTLLGGLEKAGGPEGYQAYLLHGATGSGKTEVYLRLVERALERGLGALVLVPEIALTPQLAGRFWGRFGERVALLHSGMGDGERLFQFRALREGRATIALGVRSAIFAPLQNPGVFIVDEEHDNSFKQEEGLRYNARDLALRRGQSAKALVLLGSATPSLESLYNAETGKMRLLQMRQRIHNRPLPEIQLVDLRACLQPPPSPPPQALPPEGLPPGEKPEGGDVEAVALQPSSKPPAQVLPLEGLPPGEKPEGGDVEAVALQSSSKPPAQVLPLEGLPPGEKPEGGDAEEISLLTPALRGALGEVLLNGEQAILFLNRRGYNRMWLCSGCGKAQKCRRCDICMTYHSKIQRLQCHYCGLSQHLPELCGECGGKFLKLGFGTERIEEELGAAFPSARVGRLDRDTAVSARKLHALLERFSKGELDVLIGTQMLTKGHDFHGVTLVCMLLADIGLSLPDFRAAERVFHLLTQVSGRAGRGERPGRVLLQTYHPEAQPIAYMLKKDFEGFARIEMGRRRMLAWPPHARIALIRIEGREAGWVERCARQLAHVAGEALLKTPSNVRVLGPSVAPIAKVSDKYRWQLFLKGPSYAALEIALLAVEQVVVSLPKSIKVVIDIDPATML